MDNNNNKEEILLDGKEAKPLVLAALGCPYYLVVQDDVSRNDKTLIHSHVSTGFNVGYVFDWLMDFAKNDEDFRQVLLDFVIDASQELTKKI